MASQEKAQLHLQSGNNLYQQGDYTGAIKEYQKAIELKADDALAYHNWGLALGNLGRHTEAIEKYQKAIELKADDALAYHDWGVALANLGRHTEAIEKYQKAIEIDPNSGAYEGWLKALDKLNEDARQKAIEKYQKTIELKPNDALPYYKWGLALANLGRHTEAIEKYQKATELKADYALAYNNWGVALADLGQHTEAIEKYQKATELKADLSVAYFNCGIAFSAQNRYEEAIKQYQKAIQADEDYAYAYHNIAHYLWKQGKYQDGREAWEKARRVYERTKSKAKGINNADYFNYYGSLLHEIFGALKEAEQIYNEGLELNPNHIGILSGLLDLYIEKKDETTKKDWNVNDRTSAYWKAGELYYKALGILEAQLKETDTASLLRRLGELHLKMREYEKAEKWLMAALEKDKKSAVAYADLGVLFTRKEDYKRGAQYFELALNQDPDDLTVWSNLAETYLKLNLNEKAETEYNKILRITPYHVDSQIGLGEVYKAMAEKDGDMYNQAIYHFTKAIDLAGSEKAKASKRLRASELAAAYYSRGYARVKPYEPSKALGDERLLWEALEDFKKCYELDADNHKARRAKEKLEKRLSHFSSHWFTTKIGPWLILVPSLIILALSQSSFFLGIPNKSINQVGYYVALTFGSLVFMVVGLYLPQILKLEIAGVKLEKSSVDQITTPGPIGISK